MAELEEATRRLQSAIERLDRAAVARADLAATAAGADQDQLRAELDRAAEEQKRLQAVASEAGTRIDSALGRLNTLLGE